MVTAFELPANCNHFVSQAINGYGVDRHLLGLKLIAIETGQNVPEIFMDVGYITSSHYRISSSQVRPPERRLKSFKLLLRTFFLLLFVRFLFVSRCRPNATHSWCTALWCPMATAAATTRTSIPCISARRLATAVPRLSPDSSWKRFSKASPTCTTYSSRIKNPGFEIPTNVKLVNKRFSFCFVSLCPELLWYVCFDLFTP